MKWYAVEPQRGVDEFEDADRLVRFARRHGQSVYGHTLVWHNQLPSWLTEGSFSKPQLKRDPPAAHLRRRRALPRQGPRVGRRQRGDQRRRQLARHDLLPRVRPALRGRWRCAGPTRPTRTRSSSSTTTTSRASARRATPTSRSPRTCAAAACRSTASASRATWRCSTTSRAASRRTCGASRGSAWSPRSPRSTSASRCRPRTRARGAGRRFGRPTTPACGPAVRDLHGLGLHRQVLVGAGRLPRRGRGDAIRRGVPAEAGVVGHPPVASSRPQPLTAPVVRPRTRWRSANA